MGAHRSHLAPIGIRQKERALPKRRQRFSAQNSGSMQVFSDQKVAEAVARAVTHITDQYPKEKGLVDHRGMITCLTRWTYRMTRSPQNGRFTIEARSRGDRRDSVSATFDPTSATAAVIDMPGYTIPLLGFVMASLVSSRSDMKKGVTIDVRMAWQRNRFVDKTYPLLSLRGRLDVRSSH